jgi:hypothetical protein
MIQEARETINELSFSHWTKTELEKGKIVKIKTFPKDKKVKLFRGKSLYRLARNTSRLTT